MDHFFIKELINGTQPSNSETDESVFVSLTKAGASLSVGLPGFSTAMGV
jgi:hypothetical protein